MLLGVLMKGVNALYFGSAIDFLFEFIPQFLFLSAVFGYMDVLIVIKWTNGPLGVANKPGLINTMIGRRSKILIVTY
jgi:V-type H+-transporting ATPase subunit a